jgi:hypothetical protein
LNTKETITFADGNRAPGFGQSQESGGIKPVLGLKNSPFLNWISNSNTRIINHPLVSFY